MLVLRMLVLLLLMLLLMPVRFRFLHLGLVRVLHPFNGGKLFYTRSNAIEGSSDADVPRSPLGLFRTRPRPHAHIRDRKSEHAA